MRQDRQEAVRRRPGPARRPPGRAAGAEGPSRAGSRRRWQAVRGSSRRNRRCRAAGPRPGARSGGLRRRRCGAAPAAAPAGTPVSASMVAARSISTRCSSTVRRAWISSSMVPCSSRASRSTAMRCWRRWARTSSFGPRARPAVTLAQRRGGCDDEHGQPASRAWPGRAARRREPISAGQRQRADRQRAPGTWHGAHGG